MDNDKKYNYERVDNDQENKHNLILGLIPIVGIYFSAKNFTSTNNLMIVLAVLELAVQLMFLILILFLLLFAEASSSGTFESYSTAATYIKDNLKI